MSSHWTKNYLDTSNSEEKKIKRMTLFGPEGIHNSVLNNVRNHTNELLSYITKSVSNIIFEIILRVKLTPINNFKLWMRTINVTWLAFCGTRYFFWYSNVEKYNNRGVFISRDVVISCLSMCLHLACCRHAVRSWDTQTLSNKEPVYLLPSHPPVTIPHGPSTPTKGFYVYPSLYFIRSIIKGNRT